MVINVTHIQRLQDHVTKILSHSDTKTNSVRLLISSGSRL